MFIAEWFPHAYQYGITWAEFWDMNPSIILSHKEGYRLSLQTQNIFSHVQGLYFREALLSTVGNMFKKKSADPYEYPTEPYDFFGVQKEERKRQENVELSDEEKKRQTEALFMVLSTMQSNFNLSKDGGE